MFGNGVHLIADLLMRRGGKKERKKHPNVNGWLVLRI